MATTTSKNVFVWAWSAGATEPVPAGALSRRGGATELSFRYGEQYRARRDAVPLYGMPFDGPTWHPATHNLGMPAAIRDASPDSWGRRVILQRIRPTSQDTTDLDEVTYLMQSGSNRFGALDFQASASDYVPRVEAATLDELLDAAEFVEKGIPLPEHLERALLYGTAIGDTRPKALLADDRQQLIAKFSTTTDSYARRGPPRRASITSHARLASPVTDADVVTRWDHKVSLLQRFFRADDWGASPVVSGLTMLDLPETFMPSGSYPDLLDVLSRESGSAKHFLATSSVRGLQIAIGNPRPPPQPRAASGDGKHLELTPRTTLSPCPAQR